MCLGGLTLTETTLLYTFIKNACVVSLAKQDEQMKLEVGDESTNSIHTNYRGNWPIKRST